MWKSDGTAAGTIPVKDINPDAADATPEQLTEVNGTLFFSANDGSHGRELWKSDGTAERTVLVKDLAAGATGSNPTDLISIPMVANQAGSSLPQAQLPMQVIFSAADELVGRELWQTDGTNLGTRLVQDIVLGAEDSTPTNVRVVDSTLVFEANDSQHGWQLWAAPIATLRPIKLVYLPYLFAP